MIHPEWGERHPSGPNPRKSRTGSGGANLEAPEPDEPRRHARGCVTLEGALRYRDTQSVSSTLPLIKGSLWHLTSNDSCCVFLIGCCVLRSKCP